MNDKDLGEEEINVQFQIHCTLAQRELFYKEPPSAKALKELTLLHQITTLVEFYIRGCKVS